MLNRASRTRWGVGLINGLTSNSIFLLIVPDFIFELSFKKKINYETINCIINPKFFIPLEKQQGQLNLSDLSSVNIFSLLKTIIINFLIQYIYIIIIIIYFHLGSIFMSELLTFS